MYYLEQLCHLPIIRWMHLPMDTPFNLSYGWDKTYTDVDISSITYTTGMK